VKEDGKLWNAIIEFATRWHEQQVNSVDLADVGDCCPACKSTNFSDSSTYENNGIIGSGYASWKTSDSRTCNDCGCMFKPIKGN